MWNVRGFYDSPTSKRQDTKGAIIFTCGKVFGFERFSLVNVQEFGLLFVLNAAIFELGRVAIEGCFLQEFRL